MSFPPQKTLRTRMYNACAMDMDMAFGSRCYIGSDSCLLGPAPVIKSGNEAPGQHVFVSETLEHESGLSTACRALPACLGLHAMSRPWGH